MLLLGAFGLQSEVTAPSFLFSVNVFLPLFCESDDRANSEPRNQGKWLFLSICQLALQSRALQLLVDKGLIETVRWQVMTMLFEVWGSYRCKDWAAAWERAGKMMSTVITK